MPRTEGSSDSSRSRLIHRSHCCAAPAMRASGVMEVEHSECEVPTMVAPIRAWLRHINTDVLGEEHYKRQPRAPAGSGAAMEGTVECFQCQMISSFSFSLTNPLSRRRERSHCVGHARGRALEAARRPLSECSHGVQQHAQQRQKRHRGPGGSGGVGGGIDTDW